MVSKQNSKEARKKIRARIRAKISGTAQRPRLAVFRSANHIYAQLIDDAAGVTLAAASSMDKGFEGNGGNKEAAHKVGLAIAQRAKEKNIETVVFDRGGFVYHGRVKELAEGAREGGLKF
jgi:large subunit ribosomal protein L18